MAHWPGAGKDNEMNPANRSGTGSAIDRLVADTRTPHTRQIMRAGGPGIARTGFPG
jgi:hypothetical protein